MSGGGVLVLGRLPTTYQGGVICQDPLIYRTVSCRREKGVGEVRDIPTVNIHIALVHVCGYGTPIVKFIPADRRSPHNKEGVHTALLFRGTFKEEKLLEAERLLWCKLVRLRSFPYLVLEVRDLHFLRRVENRFVRGSMA